MANTTIPTPVAFVESNPLLHTIVLAIFIFFIGLIVGRIAGRFVERFFASFEIDKLIKKKGISFSVQKMAGLITSYSVYIIFLVLALNQIGITNTLVTVIIIAFLSLIAFTLLVWLKESIPNFLALNKIQKKQLVSLGEHISIKGVKGEVVKVGTTQVTVKTLSGDYVYVPNSLLVQEKSSLENTAVNK
ncbi:MAG: mechanosensitive ion channel domain-containing protein [Candidatus Nanoarchaeia archaeon]